MSNDWDQGWDRAYGVTPKQKDWSRVVLGPGWFRLGGVVRAALRLLLLVTIARIALHLWGLSMFSDAFEQGNVDRVQRYDDFDVFTGVVSLVLLVVAGVTWMVWQYRLAKSAEPRELRRGPGWHAFAWITPVVGLWFPYQNVVDLWKRRFPGRGWAVLAWWWAAYVVTNLMDRVYIATQDDADSLEEITHLVRLELVSTVISAVALVLAVRIHRTLSDAELTPAGTPVD